MLLEEWHELRFQWPWVPRVQWVHFPKRIDNRECNRLGRYSSITEESVVSDVETGESKQQEDVVERNRGWFLPFVAPSTVGCFFNDNDDVDDDELTRC